MIHRFENKFQLRSLHHKHGLKLISLRLSSKTFINQMHIPTTNPFFLISSCLPEPTSIEVPHNDFIKNDLNKIFHKVVRSTIGCYLLFLL